MREERKVMSETFFIDHESCAFTFDGKNLQWRDKTVPVDEIISIDFEHRSRCCEKDIKKGTLFDVFSRSRKKRGEHDSLIIHYAHYLQGNKMRKCSVQFHGETCQITEWWKMLQESLESVSRERPKSCLVFINPFSGRRNAVDIYMKKVKPLLDVAGVIACVTVTKSRCDFRKVIYAGVERYDAIVALGGDGTVSEILNCLLYYQMDSVIPNRVEKDLIVPKIMIPIAIIPCGSTDCIAYSLNGTRDAETNTLHAIFGNRCRFDVCRVISRSNLQKFFVSIFTYGYMSELVKESEKFRWMGPVRYNYAGVLTLVRSKKYFGRISFTGEECGKKPADSFKKCNDNGQMNNLERDPNSDEEKSAWMPQTMDLRGTYFLIACANISCSSELIPNGIAQNCSGTDGYLNIILFQPMTICDLFKMYSRLTSREKGTHLADLPFVTMYRSKEVTIDVSDVNSTVKNCANCDGEFFDDSCVTIKVYADIALFFTKKLK